MRLPLNNLFFYLLSGMFCLLNQNVFAQGSSIFEIVFPSKYVPVIKDANKQSDLPEITDTTAKKAGKIDYSIVSYPITTKYEVSPIQPAKMVNEPLSKLYYSQLKLGFGNYTMPYGELFINSLRSKETVYGFRYKHLSSNARLQDVGFSGFSDNEASLYGKRFYKKHTLSGDLNYMRNVVNLYGYPDSLSKRNDFSDDFTRQRFSTIEAKLNLISHFTDTNKINHNIHLNYYNIGDINGTYENNIFADGLIQTKISGEHLNILAISDYYNVQSNKDTLNNYIFKLSPYFNAEGEKWKADVGLTVAVDKFSGNAAKFYFYPRLSIFYNVYNNVLVPYAGLSGGLEKNSFRSISSANPFVLSYLNYRNTSNTYLAYGGLRGALSSNTSYDAKVSYGRYMDMPFFMINYDNFLSNKYVVVYDNATLLNVNGQLKYQMKEKLNIIAKGNYYSYKTSSLTYAWHKPNFDIKLSGIYNLKSKIILKADVFYIGSQLAYQRINMGIDSYRFEKGVLKGVADINLGAEYRYSKMLSFFVNLNNIGNFRYYRWDRYPTQRFNAMIGLTFVPF